MVKVSRAVLGAWQRSARSLLVFLHISNAEHRALSSQGSTGLTDIPRGPFHP